jgi:thiol-disulfide isomerase/thioredoxin
LTAELVVKIIPILRMDCPTCIPLLEGELKRIKGVKEARGNYLKKTLKVTYNPTLTQIGAIEAAIERLGYRIAYKKYPGVLSRLRGFLNDKKNDAFPSLIDSDFQEKVLHPLKPVIVLFSSPNCPTCHVFKRQFREITQKVKEKADLYEMNITSTDRWRKYDIVSIPTVLIFKNGHLSRRFPPFPQSEDIIQSLEL